MFCTKCGIRIPTVGKFCPACGFEITKENIDTIEEIIVVSEEKAPSSVKSASPFQYVLYGKNFVIDDLIILSSQNHMLYWNIGKSFADPFQKEFLTYTRTETKIDLITQAVDNSEAAAAQIVINKHEQQKDFSHDKKMIIDQAMPLLKAPKIAKAVFDEIMNVIQLRNTNRIQRRIAKDNRFQIQGGGFGISGAAKGIITASIFNATTGVLYSILHSGSKEERRYRYMIEELLNDTTCQSISDAILEDCVTFCDFDKDASIYFYQDRQKALQIYQRLTKKEIAQEHIVEAFLSMLSIYPANPKFYKWALDHLGNSDGELLRLMDTLKIK